MMTDYDLPSLMEGVYTSDELSSLPGEAPGSGPVRLGVIGNPIAHSKSPQLQQAALDQAGIEVSYIRIFCETEPGAFPALLVQLASRHFIGANVTVPFKRKAYAACRSSDALASLSQAVNTLVLKPDGWHGYNTDGPGFERAIAELTGCQLSDLSILILGACGGAGSALACQCTLSGCPRLTLVNRPKPALGELSSLLASHSRNPGDRIHACSFGDAELEQRIAEADLVVNATSLGLRAGDPLPIPVSVLKPGQFFYDIVPHDTPLRQQAAAQGCQTADGLSMLLWQGAYAFRHWFGFLPDVEVMRRALLV